MLLLSAVSIHFANLWKECWHPEFADDLWAKEDPRLPSDDFSKLSRDWNWDTPLRTDYARRQALIEIDVLVGRALDLTVDELCAIYRIQFPVLRQNENDTWYDQNGRIVYTCSMGLPGVGYPRKANKENPVGWEDIKDLPAGETVTRTVVDSWLPGEPQERVIEYIAPFDRCNREEDYRTAWAAFDAREQQGREIEEALAATKRKHGKPVVIAYPELEREAALCSYVLSILEQAESMPKEDLLDTVLVGMDANALEVLAGVDAGSKMGLLSEFSDSIGWQKCLDYLENRKAINVSRFGDHMILAGSEMVTTTQTWSHDYTELAGYAIKANARMKELEPNPVKEAAEEQVFQYLEARRLVA